MKTVLKIAREREREFWLKYCTFAWGPVTPPCIGGEARGYLGAVPPRELPSPFPAVLESRLSPPCSQEPARGAAQPFS